MDVLKIDKYLGQVQNRVKRVGIELEGAWSTLPPDVVAGQLEIVRDGSLDDFAESLGKYRDKYRVGEIVSQPMMPIEMAGWVKANYPQKIHEKCGMHIHMSFADAAHYEALMIPEYTTTVISYLTRWAEAELDAKHPIWPRLMGKNIYCLPEFQGVKQAVKKKKDYRHDIEGSRYTAINYCFDMHNTVECRVLPMMDDAITAVKALQQVVDITNACLLATAKKDVKVGLDVPFTKAMMPYRSGLKVRQRT